MPPRPSIQVLLEVLHQRLDLPSQTRKRQRNRNGRQESSFERARMSVNTLGTKVDSKVEFVRRSHNSKTRQAVELGCNFRGKLSRLMSSAATTGSLAQLICWHAGMVPPRQHSHTINRISASSANLEVQHTLLCSPPLQRPLLACTEQSSCGISDRIMRALTIMVVVSRQKGPSWGNWKTQTSCWTTVVCRKEDICLCYKRGPMHKPWKS